MGSDFDPAIMTKARNANFQSGYISGKVGPSKKGDAAVGGKKSYLMTGVAALAGATVAGVFLIGGASASDFATSFSGSLGAASGFAIGTYLDTTDEVMKYSSKELLPIWPVVGAVAVPAMAAGELDTDIAILAAGAYAGSYAYCYYLDSSKK
jgi:hypothetical protein